MGQVIDIDGQVLTKTTYKSGTIEYRDAKGQYHRTGGPAYIHPDGHQAYYVNGKLHRLEGPALIWWNGTKEYWVDGKRHRTNGPAVTNSDGTLEYWVDYIEYTEEDYQKAVLKFKLKQLVG